MSFNPLGEKGESCVGGSGVADKEGGGNWFDGMREVGDRGKDSKTGSTSTS